MQSHATFRRRLVEVGGRQSSVRTQELEELQSVALAQHLDVNPFAKAARSSRSNLRMCTYSFELLMHHLQVGGFCCCWQAEQVPLLCNMFI